MNISDSNERLYLLKRFISTIITSYFSPIKIIVKRLKKNWLFVLNPLIIIISYFIIYDNQFSGVELLLALTFMANLVYWGYKLFSKPPKKV